MEYNKDGAVRSKEISEKKFAAKDIWGAKKFSLKPQKLYPRLDGLHQMLETLDVYLSPEKKIGRKSDWYKILGVSPDANDDTLRRNYRKMALILHPDKKKSIGVDGAFKILSEA
ncbi:hypothetical protein GIB67_012175 [Kingdonia uniflora]|uniref:J domain-containing protein n=1 Tax=Kingdonia uniflora TaxID=39325 RepID=A0A7J7NNH6_9MAGN|nr:hypothetical protein GIB67_012175 [Kingdonia uniflora]